MSTICSMLTQICTHYIYVRICAKYKQIVYIAQKTGYFKGFFAHNDNE